MTFKSYLGLYGLTALAFVVIDFIWLGVVAADFYQKHLGHLLRPEFLKLPAILFTRCSSAAYWSSPCFRV